MRLIPENQQEEYTWTFLGCRGSYSVCAERFMEFGGLTNCSIIKSGDYALILDCGTGLYEARPYLKDCRKIDIILSHVHYDHCLGLLDFSVFPKEAELNFYGNFSEWRGEKTLNDLFAAPFWPVDLVRGNMHQIPGFGEKMKLGKGMEIRFYRSKHPNGACCYEITASNLRFCILVDCELSDVFPFEIIKNCDILLYDGMYADDEYEEHKGYGHSTWQEGCRLASKAAVRNLILTHHNPMRSDEELREIEKAARQMFPETLLARSGMEIIF